MKCLSVHLEIQQKIFGFLNCIYLPEYSSELFLQYHIGIKYTDTIALPTHEDLSMIHSNVSNILGITVNRYQNNISE